MAESLWSYAALSFASLLAVLSPFATIPPFLAMTQGDEADERIDTARRACTVAFFVLITFALLGMRILNAFGITLPAFEIAGGIVILRVALEMLKGSRELKVSPEERIEGSVKDDIAITPLAVPMLCGPATITTGILLGGQALTIWHHMILVIDILLIYLFTFGTLWIASTYTWVIGEIALKVMSRLFGLLLAALAVQFMLNGAERVWGT